MEIEKFDLLQAKIERMRKLGLRAKVYDSLDIFPPQNKRIKMSETNEAVKGLKLKLKVKLETAKDGDYIIVTHEEFERIVAESVQRVIADMFKESIINGCSDSDVEPCGLLANKEFVDDVDIVSENHLKAYMNDLYEDLTDENKIKHG